MRRADSGETALLGARVSMEPAGFTVTCQVQGAEIVVEGDTFAAPAHAGDAVRIEPEFDGEVLQLTLEARRQTIVKSCEVVLRHAFATDELVLLNGYQSWTDTAERPAWARMRGLRGVPGAVVDRWSLDALGDYQFVEYSGKAGAAHGFTYATFRRGEGMVLVASLDESRGFTLIRTDAPSGRVTLQTEAQLQPVSPGQRVQLGRYVIARGTEDDCFDRWFQLAGIEARRVRPLTGYTSWYRHYGDIDERKLLSDLDGMRAHARREGQLLAGGTTAKPAGATGEHSSNGREGRLSAPGAISGKHAAGHVAWPLALFQIDDGYCKVGDWLNYDAAKFPQGLKPLAERIREAGFLPGLWVAPFVCERESRLFAERGDWLLRDEHGDPVPTGSHWSGGFALDTRNVEVRSYLLDVLGTVTREWGFGLLKLDFLYAACLRPHDGLNRGQLMADAMRLVRTGAGDDTLILGCGVPLASAFGVVDYCRIGCDVGLDWDDKPHMRLLHRERVSTKHSLGNTYARKPLDGRAFGNDPDVFFLRDDVKLSQAQRDELLFADADSGSVLLTSDDRSTWSDSMWQRYDEALRVFLERHGALR